jgi:protein-L-isoaspartate O-methyltransferase
LGYEKEAPYDAIHVGAAAPEIPKAVNFLINFYNKPKLILKN